MNFPFGGEPNEIRPVLRRPQSGVGTRLSVNDLGFSYSAEPGAGSSFRHPFRASLGVSSVIFSRGLVDTFEPVIGALPISGGDGRAAPPLKLEQSEVNANGESWACVEVVPNGQGKLDEDSRIEIVHTDTPTSLNPAIGRAPLALIVWRQRAPFLLFQVVHFNLRYLRYTPPPGGGPVRHLFL